MTTQQQFQSMPLGSLVTPTFGTHRGCVGEVSVHNYVDNTIEVYFSRDWSAIVIHVDGLKPADDYEVIPHRDY